MIYTGVLNWSIDIFALTEQVREEVCNLTH